MSGLSWVDGAKYGYYKSEIALTDGAQYSVAIEPDSDDYVAIILDNHYDNHRKKVFDNRADAKDYCEQIKIERNE